MKANRIDELTEYFAPFGLTYSGDRHKWNRDGFDRVRGPYRGVELQVVGERKRDGSAYVGDGLDQTSIYHATYRNFLAVSVKTTPSIKPSIAVIPRNEYALVSKHGLPVVNGKVIMPGGQFQLGADVMHNDYIAVNRLLQTGVPEFDAQLGVICPDEQHAHNLLRPELARWIAQDQRSYGTRIHFSDELVSVFFRTGRQEEPPELFRPEWIFPAADYLIDLLRLVPADIMRPAPAET